MSLFCFFVVPLFIAFRLSLGHRFEGRKGIALAVVLGFAAALLRLAIGNIIPSGVFGFLRWLHLFADRAALPALLPLGVWLFLRRVRGSSFLAESTDFALIWLVPVAVFRAVSWEAAGDPAQLVLAPLLWIAIAVGVPRFVEIANEEYGIRFFGAVTIAVLLPLLGTTASWAFFVHRPFVGFLSFAACSAPLVWWTFSAFAEAGRSRRRTVDDGRGVTDSRRTQP